MKIYLTLLFFILSSAYGATCTNTTRTNYTSNQVLTSSALNADFNQLVTKANALDGGCVSDNTLESTAFDSSLDALKNGIHQGCALSYSDANTVSVGKCILSVNGKFIKTTVATTVTWGGASSAEVVSTQYYVYALTTSGGSTLNLLISTVAPGTDGLDVSGNKVIGRFYNNSSSAITASSIFSWNTNKFSQADAGLIGQKDSFFFNYGTGNITTVCSANPCLVDQTESFVTGVSWNSAGAYTITFARSYSKIKCMASVMLASLTPGSPLPDMSGSNVNTLTISTYLTASPYTQSNTYGTVHCEGY